MPDCPGRSSRMDRWPKCENFNGDGLASTRFDATDDHAFRCDTKGRVLPTLTHDVRGCRVSAMPHSVRSATRFIALLVVPEASAAW